MKGVYWSTGSRVVVTSPGSAFYRRRGVIHQDTRNGALVALERQLAGERDWPPMMFADGELADAYETEWKA